MKALQAERRKLENFLESASASPNDESVNQAAKVKMLCPPAQPLSDLQLAHVDVLRQCPILQPSLDLQEPVLELLHSFRSPQNM
jgi:hypothetical protein